MLEQTRNAINDLKASGLKRSEFRVQCERLMRDHTFVGYGDLNIILLCSLSRILEVLPELVKHFNVIQYIDNGKVRDVHVYEAKGTPRLITYALKKGA